VKIKILSVGKNKETWLSDALEEYVKRLRPVISIEFCLAKNDEQLMQWIEKEERGLIGLDPLGQPLTSENFSIFLNKRLEAEGGKLCFVIGGSDGLPQLFKEKVPLVSLSSLTFTHQMTRLILLEQIYRSFEITRNSKYHK
jgi:23S rRNA (pseudouridine1915-N3)-methyltransferase